MTTPPVDAPTTISHSLLKTLFEAIRNACEIHTDFKVKEALLVELTYALRILQRPAIIYVPSEKDKVS